MPTRPDFKLIALAIVCAACLGSAAQAKDPATFVGAYVLPNDISDFGGLSGLRFAPDGLRFHTASDKSRLFSGQVTRDTAGAITGFTLDGPPIRWRDAKKHKLLPPYSDSESLEVLPDGSFLVSFEGKDRIARFKADGQQTEQLPSPREFSGFETNSGLEAMAVAPDGSVFTMPEGDADGVTSFPVFRYAQGRWSIPFHLPEDHTWRPVDADFGPDGRLYILERDFWGLLGFRSRLRRITLAGDSAQADEVMFTSNLGQFGNLEGLSVWQDAGGHLRATMVSDNNLLAFMTSEFVDYLLPK